MSLYMMHLNIELGLNCLYTRCKSDIKKYRVFTVALHATLSVKLTLNCLYTTFKFGLKA